LCSCGAGVARPQLPDACQERADTLRTRWESSEHALCRHDPQVIAYRVGWDAHAAGEYPLPVLADAAAVAAVYPELADRAWHHAAGATILGAYCCGTPASHRDALVTMAHVIRRQADQ
jgi:hypothetical protein